MSRCSQEFLLIKLIILKYLYKDGLLSLKSVYIYHNGIIIVFWHN